MQIRTRAERLQDNKHLGLSGAKTKTIFGLRFSLHKINFFKINTIYK